jgi:hypothetical protein
VNEQVDGEEQSKLYVYKINFQKSKMRRKKKKGKKMVIRRTKVTTKMMTNHS